MQTFQLPLLFFAIIKCSQEWSYSNENPWPEKYCKKGITQSPIDLVDGEDTVELTGPELSFENLDQEYDATVTNDGHKVIISSDTTGKILVSGGRLPGIYQLDHFGIHWNSAHTINGERKALELNSEWCNTLFENCDEAGEYKDGTTVLSTLFEFQEEDNKILDPIIKSLDEIGQANTSSKIKLNPRSLFPTDLTRFYRYWGSYSRPDCPEGKPWTIFLDLCKISQNQVNQFMQLKGENGEVLKKTYRNTQNSNHRIILKITTS